jgi:peptidoglycan/LPS O-acetylase OafA/YrhL
MQLHRVKELDALRGIAALMVVFYHYTVDRPQANLGFNVGTTGVELFFMISGFVIFMSLNAVNSSRQFVINRFSRLYPTYWASVTLTFLSLSLYSHLNISHQELLNYLSNLTMFQFYMSVADIDDSYWTLIIEMTFYIVMLVFFHFNKLKYINFVFVPVISLVTIFGLFFYDNEVVKNTFIWVQLLPYLPLFLSGIIFYKLYFQKTKLLQNYSLLLFCLVAQILFYNYTDRFVFAMKQPQYIMMLVIYYSIFTLIVNKKLNFIVCRVSVFFGKISFAMYLIHQAISVKILIPYFMNDLHFNFWIATLVFSLPLVIIMASLITFYIEIPLGKYIKHKLFANKIASI